MGWIQEATFGDSMNPYDRPMSKEEQEKLREKLAREAAEEKAKKAAADIEWRRQREEAGRKIDAERKRKSKRFEELKRQYESPRAALNPKYECGESRYATLFTAQNDGGEVAIEIGHNKHCPIKGKEEVLETMFEFYCLAAELWRLDEIGYVE